MPSTLTLHDCAPRLDNFYEEVVQGLSRDEKTLPCKFFYDEHGSQLFDQICEQPEYYPTRTEAAIMREHGAAMAEALGPHVRLVEYGSGSSTKTRLLLDHLACPAAYVPMDISREHLMRSAAGLAAAYPHVEVRPVCADYTQPFTLPSGSRPAVTDSDLFPRLDDRQFSPRSGGAFSARHGAGRRAERWPADRRGPEEVADRLGARLQRPAGRDSGVQPQPADAHQPGTGRDIRPEWVGALRALQ